MRKITTALGALIALVFMFSTWIHLNPKFPVGLYSIAKSMPSLGFIVLGLALIALFLLIVPIFFPGDSAHLTINNKSQVTIKIYRLGANNYQSQYNSLSPGNSVTQRSSMRGEWWMITDANGNCQMIVAPPNVVNIK